MKVGFDLDGIFVGGPPFVPKGVLEWLHRGPQTNGPSYRFPTTKIEQLVRKLSHFYLFRPKIQKNIDFLHHLPQNFNSHALYLISSRYSFLKDLTNKLLKRYDLIAPFISTNLNIENQQPHLFKEEMIKKLKIDLFVDDDLRLLRFLKERFPKLILLWYNPRSPFHPPEGIIKIKSLSELENFLT